MDDCRSFLFVPGDRPERFDKAFSTAADAVIIDLEDAVSPENKAAARSNLIAFAQADRAGRQKLWVRVNAASSEKFVLDLNALAKCSPAGIMLSKAEDAQSLEVLAERFEGVKLLPLIETAKGFDALDIICAATNVVRIAFGSIDFQHDLGIGGDGNELLLFRSQMVLKSRLAELAPPVDGVSLAIKDAAGLMQDSQRARRIGFGGKLCIHPEQVKTVNEAFSPTRQEVEAAQQIVDGVNNSSHGAVMVDGKMVDKPVFERAQKVLALASRTRG